MAGGLTLSLKPREKFLVGGCLVENGPKKSSIKIIDESVRVLRLSDALHPDEVKTPVTRAYHLAQMILACAVEETDARQDLLNRLNELQMVFEETPACDLIARATEAAGLRRYHAVLGSLKTVIGLEAHLLEKILLEQQALTRNLADCELPRTAAAR
ncbi:flagellar biosynthesis repressor FlbT [Parvularcula marina]|uniref:flagellar biosynthesis repressor FlbT n=1 Tax=Parvularcula marina TaxID=2292771 RepID=UPI003515CAB7